MAFISTQSQATKQNMTGRTDQQSSRTVSTPSSSDSETTDEDRDDRQTWHKSPLHVRRGPRRDRPLSGEIHYLPSMRGTGSDGDGPTRRVPRMGSPVLYRRDTPKALRTARRLSAPNMGSRSTNRKYGNRSPRESSELVQVRNGTWK